jgi:hypothetical protein
MADFYTTNPVKPLFLVNKYDDIDGGRVAQETPRGRFAFKDATTGRLTLPRNLGEAQKAVWPVDWAKPLNPGPYFLNGNGLNGTTLYPFNDGSLYQQENDFDIDPDVAFTTPWPAAVGPEYDISPLFYNKPIPSGAMCLVYDGTATFTFGSGAYVGQTENYVIGSKVYVDYTTGNEGKLTVSGSAAGNTVVGVVVNKNLFADPGNDTITVKIKGVDAL